MQDTIIKNWNGVVSRTDDVYILGDVFWKNEGAGEILNSLNGNKFLILGNHDRVNAEMKEHYVWVKEYAEIKDNGRHVVLCHYPISSFKNADYGYIHLYGHIHEGRDYIPFEKYLDILRSRGIPNRSYNVGCMLPYMNYTPRTLDEIMSNDLSHQMDLTVSTIVAMKDNMTDMRNTIEVLKNYEEITTDQANKIVKAARYRVISLLGEYDKRYFGRFVRRLYSDAKKSGLLGNTINRTHKGDYPRVINYIESWIPQEGIFAFKQKIYEEISAQK